MAFADESAGSQTLQIFRTTVDLVEPVAAAAEEMVVVVLAGQLVSRRSSRHVHDGEPALSREHFQVTVDRGDPDSAGPSSRGGQDFLRADRSVDGLHDLENRIPLPRPAFHQDGRGNRPGFSRLCFHRRDNNTALSSGQPFL